MIYKMSHTFGLIGFSSCRWAQSFLVGVPKVLCGFRDDDGMVVKLEDYPTMVLPKMGKNWLPNVCMNFLNQLLAYVYQLINPIPPPRNSAPDSQSSTNNTEETVNNDSEKLTLMEKPGTQFSIILFT